jgi:hypothetical protein
VKGRFNIDLGTASDITMLSPPVESFHTSSLWAPPGRFLSRPCQRDRCHQLVLIRQSFPRRYVMYDKLHEGCLDYLPEGAWNMGYLQREIMAGTCIVTRTGKRKLGDVEVTLR